MPGGPLRVDSRLLFQPIGFRWADNLRDRSGDAREIGRFVGYYDALARSSVGLLAMDSVTVR
jgi:hypothetical protein